MTVYNDHPKEAPKRPLVLAFGLALTGLTTVPALAQTRAEQQVRDTNRAMSQQLQFQQQNQNFQWQLDNQRMRQQIDIPRSGGGSATCPAGSVGC
jgi:UDP-N-acetylmuramoylalanine-D-glutamate ligase